MSTLVTRAGKGSPLTHNEVDANFTNLNTDKVEKTSAAITGGTINGTVIGGTTPAAGTFTTLTAQTEVLKGTGNNFLLQSNTLNTTWTAASSTVATTVATLDPFGGSNAWLVTASASGAVGITQTLSLVNLSSTYTLSVYAKAGTSTFLRLFTSNVSPFAWFNLSTGAVGTVQSGSTATITSVGNGWYRCSITSLSNNTIGIRLADSDGNTQTTSGTALYLYGAQLEIGSTANTYIPTTTTAVYGTPTLSFSGVAGLGLQSDGSLYASSAGTGNVRFYTNNIGQEQARVSHTTSAVNYHQLTGSATGSGPIHSVAGSDTNIDLNLTTKGTGAVNLNTGGGTQFSVANTASATNYFATTGSNGGTPALYSAGASTNIGANFVSKGTGALAFYTNGSLAQFVVTNTASAVNYVQVTGAATGGVPTISAQGSDSNVSLFLNAKGTGNVFLQVGGANVFQAAGSSTSVNRVLTQASNTGVAPIVQAVGSDTNIPLVLQPKGTGALQAQQTTSTATGGNARGANAVDWQTSRASASQVASATASVLAGGFANTVGGVYSGVLAGLGNSGSGTASTALGGQNQTSSGSYSAALGGYGNSATGFYGFVGEGYANSTTSNSVIATQSATMNGTTAVTLSGSNASIKVGQLIAGTYISGPPHTYVAAVSGTSLTLSQVASGSGTATLTFYTPHGVVVGGGNNQATGSYSFIGGGGDAGTAANRNVASGDWSVVGGGVKNVASGAGSVISGGGTFSDGSISGNTANGAASAIVGGRGHTASGTQSFIGGGFIHVASGTNSVVAGGYVNTANGEYSAILGGVRGITRSISGFQATPAHVNPIADNFGVSQGGVLILGTQTTDATATVLRSNTSAASTTNQIILPNNSAYAFKGTVIANVTGGGNTKAWAIEGAIKRGANAASTALVGTPTVTSAYADAGAATWDITATADTTNGGLKITFTGQAATTIRCVAKLETTEVTF